MLGRLQPISLGMERMGGGAVAAEFDAKAAHYETNRLAGWYRAQNEAVLAALPAGFLGTLVDVGCGTGWLLRRAASQRPGLVGVGIDLSSGMIRQARMRGGGPTFLCADWESVALDSVRAAAGGAADVLTCVSVLHYFRDPGAALARMGALLQPGGLLILLDRAKEKSPLTVLWDFLHRFVIRDHCRFYSTSELRALLRDAGFQEVGEPRRIRRWFWKGKLFTSLVLLCGRTLAPRT